MRGLARLLLGATIVACALSAPKNNARAARTLAPRVYLPTPLGARCFGKTAGLVPVATAAQTLQWRNAAELASV